MEARCFIKRDQLLPNVSRQDKKIQKYMKTASFIFDFNSEKEAKIVAKTLYPEIQHSIPKTDVEMSVSGNRFYLKIMSEDVSSLRAACNSYLRWINTAFNVKKII